ncbi:hypothetical protein DIPPA_09171 [Diplonema papillatum]|nr:hypothetical protein DIPPA_09171 [Diplonema papillatum]
MTTPALRKTAAVSRAVSELTEPAAFTGRQVRSHASENGTGLYRDAGAPQGVRRMVCRASLLCGGRRLDVAGAQ